MLWEEEEGEKFKMAAVFVCDAQPLSVREEKLISLMKDKFSIALKCQTISEV